LSEQLRRSLLEFKVLAALNLMFSIHRPINFAFFRMKHLIRVFILSPDVALLVNLIKARDIVLNRHKPSSF